MRGVVVPPSKLIVNNIFSPKGFCFIRGVNYEGGRSNHKSSFMRGVIVPPSKFIVNKQFTQGVFFIRGFIIKGGKLYFMVDMYGYEYNLN